MVLPFWCQLTQVVLEKRQLNGCPSVCLIFGLLIATYIIYDLITIFDNFICDLQNAKLKAKVRCQLLLFGITNSKNLEVIPWDTA